MTPRTANQNSFPARADSAPPADAAAHFRASLGWAPNSASSAAAHLGLANALLAMNRATEAIPHYEAALRLKPDLVAAKEGLATARALTAAPSRP